MKKSESLLSKPIHDKYAKNKFRRADPALTRPAYTTESGFQAIVPIFHYSPSNGQQTNVIDHAK